MVKVKLALAVFFSTLLLSLFAGPVLAGGGNEMFYLINNPSAPEGTPQFTLSWNPGNEPQGVLLSKAGQAGDKKEFTVTGVNVSGSNATQVIPNILLDTAGPVEGVQIQASVEIDNDSGQKYTVLYNPITLDKQVGWQDYTMSQGVQNENGKLPMSLQNAVVKLTVWNLSKEETAVINTNSPRTGNLNSTSLVEIALSQVPVMSGVPSMVYPVDGQTIDLEGAYMFKVNQINGASGYLFGLFQDGVMTYENYRDTRTLSSNGEFALWQTNPAHNKFHAGPISVWVRALINNQWTEARIITVNLKPGTGGVAVISQPSVVPATSTEPVPSIQPPVLPPQQIVTVTDSSASAALQAKVDELQKSLEQSQQKQSALESQINQIINWIKSIFPFFK